MTPNWPTSRIDMGYANAVAPSAREVPGQLAEKRQKSVVIEPGRSAPSSLDVAHLSPREPASVATVEPHRTGIV